MKYLSKISCTVITSLEIVESPYVAYPTITNRSHRVKTNMHKIQLLALAVLLSSSTMCPAFSQGRSLKAGAARVDITPPVNPAYPPSGKYDHEKMYVRAIVLDNGETRAALVGADLPDITNPIWSGAAPVIAKELNCPVENLILSPTHSHSACPSGPPPPPFNQIPVESTVKAIVNAVQMAKAKLQPARVGFGTGAAYLNVNRDAINRETRLWTQAANLEGPSDKTLAVVTITDLNGAPIAGYMNYPMHAIDGFLTGITTADFPGAACRWVERAFKSDMVMIYTQGASGDQNPLWLRPGTNALASKTGVKMTGYEMVREKIEAPLRDGSLPHGKLDPEVADNLERWIDALGLILGEEAIRVMTNIDKQYSDVRIWGSQKIITLPGRKRTNTGREGEPGIYEDGPPVNIRLGLLGIGNIALTSIDSEIYNIFAQHLKKASPMTNTVMVTNSNGRTNSGYIIDDAAYGRNTFQVLGNRLKPGNAEQGIVGGLLDLIQQYTGGNNK
jgi:neutral ceramidase